MFIQPINITSIQIVAVQPELADAKRLDFLRANEDVSIGNHYYIVKVYLENRFAASPVLPHLYIGSEEIPMYTGFKSGLYFKVYNPKFFDEHAGESFCFSLDGQTFLDTGVKLPEKPQAISTVPRMDSSTRIPGVTFSSEESISEVLPTKDEVLRQ
ncbi:hypothetical protein [Leptolyngbya sp. FACHB-16]|uniref:hypothetical protein n=1 Tax=unclassified Leptolyngbya TaxID=2650499 RepID=UPI001683E029|nr:hypothetical protein [Leptolyngbya sp. FACHB-16]MBD2156725.1 hypothetical protein [Leptolyngbya sp. FACHB-16]